jgi:hypothetical protein
MRPPPGREKPQFSAASHIGTKLEKGGWTQKERVAMTAEIISLADRRRAADLPPPSHGNVAIAAAALAAACRALTTSLDKVRNHSAAIRADMERMQHGAAAAASGGGRLFDAAQALAGAGRSLRGVAHV